MLEGYTQLPRSGDTIPAILPRKADDALSVVSCSGHSVQLGAAVRVEADLARPRLAVAELGEEARGHGRQRGRGGHPGGVGGGSVRHRPLGKARTAQRGSV